MIYFIYLYDRMKVTMEKLKAYFFLVLIVAVQFGSSGFTYYQNICGCTGTTFVSYSDDDCCPCDEEKPYQGNSSEEQVNEECCYSVEHLVKGADEYPTRDFQLEYFDSSLFAEFSYDVSFWIDIHSDNLQFITPPITNVNTRIFIQSFQI